MASLTDESALLRVGSRLLGHLAVLARAFAATSACCRVASTLPASSASSRRRASIFIAQSTVWLSDASPSLSASVRLPVVLPDGDEDDVERHGDRGAEEHVPERARGSSLRLAASHRQRILQLEAPGADVHAVGGLPTCLPSKNALSV